MGFHHSCFASKSVLGLLETKGETMFAVLACGACDSCLSLTSSVSSFAYGVHQTPNTAWIPATPGERLSQATGSVTAREVRSSQSTDKLRDALVVDSGASTEELDGRLCQVQVVEAIFVQRCLRDAWVMLRSTVWLCACLHVFDQRHSRNNEHTCLRSGRTPKPFSPHSSVLPR